MATWHSDTRMVRSKLPFLLFVSLPASPLLAAVESPPLLVRPVRVLVAEGQRQIAIRAAGALQFFTPTGERLPGRPTLRETEANIRVSSQGLHIDERIWNTRDILVEAATGPITLISYELDGAGERTYLGRLRVLADEQLVVINEVGLEDYVASVVAGEIWPGFDVEAFRVQAIVTRTFAVYHMLRRSGSPYDLSATQGAQVYRGIRDDIVGRKAQEAAQYTRGLVCSWNDEGTERIFCTYYSAACGGMSQPAAPLGPDGDVPPLAGGVRCDFCQIAPGQTYRWGPVRMPADEVFDKLRERYPELADLGSIRSVAAAELTRFGRPLTWRITGSSGLTQDILAERFRLAVAPSLIRSTDCNVRLDGAELVFEDGKGFGHGLGLCQWGMQGQALAGRKAAQILRHYYPGSRLMRIY